MYDSRELRREERRLQRKDSAAAVVPPQHLAEIMHNKSVDASAKRHGQQFELAPIDTVAVAAASTPPTPSRLGMDGYLEHIKSLKTPRVAGATGPTGRERLKELSVITASVERNDVAQGGASWENVAKSPLKTATPEVLQVKNAARAKWDCDAPHTLATMSKAERDVVRSKRLALAKMQWRVLRAQRELETYQASQRAGIAQHDKLKKGAMVSDRLKRADEWGVFDAFEKIDKHLGCRFLDFFRLIDVVQDGSIPVDDVFSALKVAGVDMDDDVLRNVLGALDIDNDGSITYRELSLRIVEQTVRKLALNNGSIVDWNGTTSPAKRRRAIAARTMAPNYQFTAEERHEAAIQILEDEEATKAEKLGSFFRKARWKNVKSKIVKVQRVREEDEARRASLRAKRQRRGSTTPNHAARLAKHQKKVARRAMKRRASATPRATVQNVGSGIASEDTAENAAMLPFDLHISECDLRFVSVSYPPSLFTDIFDPSNIQTIAEAERAANPDRDLSDKKRAESAPDKKRGTGNGTADVECGYTLNLADAIERCVVFECLRMQRRRPDKVKWSAPGSHARSARAIFRPPLSDVAQPVFSCAEWKVPLNGTALFDITVLQRSMKETDALRPPQLLALVSALEHLSRSDRCVIMRELLLDIWLTSRQATLLIKLVASHSKTPREEHVRQEFVPLFSARIIDDVPGFLEKWQSASMRMFLDVMMGRALLDFIPSHPTGHYRLHPHHAGDRVVLKRLLETSASDAAHRVAHNRHVLKWHLIARNTEPEAKDVDAAVGHGLTLRTVHTMDSVLRHAAHDTRQNDVTGERRPSMLLGRGASLDAVVNRSLAGIALISQLEETVEEERAERAHRAAKLEYESRREAFSQGKQGLLGEVPGIVHRELVVSDLVDPATVALPLTAMLRLLPEVGEGPAPCSSFRNVVIAPFVGDKVPLKNIAAIDAGHAVVTIESALRGEEEGDLPPEQRVALEFDFVSTRRSRRAHQQPMDFQRFARFLTTFGVDDLDETIRNPYDMFLLIGRSSALTKRDILEAKRAREWKVRNTPAGRRAMCMRLATVAKACIRTLRELRRQLSSAGVLLTCRQVSLAMLCFPRYIGWTRVNALVLMFPFIHDIDNVRRCLDALEGPRCVHEAALRLGWLALFNPLRPAGYYHLNLAKHDDRRLARMLVVLRDTTAEVDPHVHHVHRSGRLSTIESSSSSSSSDSDSSSFDSAADDSEKSDEDNAATAAHFAQSRAGQRSSPVFKRAAGLSRAVMWRSVSFTQHEADCEWSFGEIPPVARDEFGAKAVGRPPDEQLRQHRTRRRRKGRDAAWFKQTQQQFITLRQGDAPAGVPSALFSADELTTKEPPKAWEPPAVWSEDHGAAIPHTGFLTVDVIEVRHIDAAAAASGARVFPHGRELLPLVLAATSVHPRRVCTSRAIEKEAAVSHLAHGSRRASTE
jgi:hypothetical protein